VDKLPLLTGGHHPRAEDSLENMLSDIVGDEVKVKRVFTVEQNALDQRHDVTCRVVLGTDDCNVYHLCSRTFAFTWGK